MTLPLVWIDGRPVPPDAPHVSSRDRGLTLADGVFETMRLQNGRIFRLDRHLRRLRLALDVLEIPAPSDLEAWLAAAGATATTGPLTQTPSCQASVRLTVTRGAAAGGVLPPADVHPTTIIAINPMPAFPESVYTRGLSAHVPAGRRNEHAVTAGLKTLCYTDAIVAMLDARRAGCDEALFLDTAGHCAEATASNLFAWRGDRLVTPPLSCGALPGITRQAILEIAAARSIRVEERPLDLSELIEGCEEAFLTSSLRGIAPLVRVQGRPIGAGVVGAVTRDFTSAYRGLIAAECGAPAAAS